MSYGWFHGDISMPESEARLNTKPEGTFLVRFSTSEVGVFTVSKVLSFFLFFIFFSLFFFLSSLLFLFFSSLFFFSFPFVVV